jgi:hypothetical protein
MSHPRGTFFCLKIKKTKGKGIPICKGFMTIKDTPIFEWPLQWHLNNISDEYIQDSKFLCLFSIDIISRNEIISDISAIYFYRSSNTSKLPFSALWRDYKGKTVEVKIESINARTPKERFKDTMENILLNAKVMNQ